MTAGSRAGLAALLLLLAGCPAANGPTAELVVEPAAARWRTLLLPRTAEHRPGPPAALTAADRAELLAWQARRTPADRTAIAYWDEQGGVPRWSELARNLAAEHGLPAPRAARALALVHVAMYDAAVAAWEAKATHRHAGPVASVPALRPVAGSAGIPSYPSEHAAIAHAAAGTLGELFPDERESLVRRAEAVGETRLAAGANSRGDVQAGQLLGEAAAAAARARARADGAGPQDATPAPIMPRALGQWYHPTPLEPGAGRWKTWFASHDGPLRFTAPPGPGTPAFQDALADVVRVGRRLTPHQRAIALKWDMEPPAIQWGDLARPLVRARGLSAPRAARVLALMHAAIADATVACYALQHQALLPRPTMADPSFVAVLATPATPSYPSDHSAAAAAAAASLEAALPDEAVALTRLAEEAANSRIFAGVNFRRDVTDGLAVGRAVAARARAWAGVDDAGH